jgi:hypothetical protein
MIIVEFAPKFHYKPGVENILVDTLSWYPLLVRREKQNENHEGVTFHDYVPPNADPEELKDLLDDCLLYFSEHLDAFP